MIVYEPIKLDFSPISISDRARYESFFYDALEHGCECSFANRFLWGEQYVAYAGDQMAVFSRFGDRFIYSYPQGEGDKRSMLDAILADAQRREIDYRLSGLIEEERTELDALYPNQFSFVCNEGSLDYVYDIHDLADLAGRKYHAKRNHCSRFETTYPDYRIQPITQENLPLARALCKQWYAERRAIDPEGDYRMEETALERAFLNYGALDLEGLLLTVGDEVVAMTMASRMSRDTFDVHFEKARADVAGAYAMINRCFARYIRDKYPEIRYLNREEDMGIEGLRRAKESYCPHHRVVKYRAIPREEKV